MECDNDERGVEMMKLTKRQKTANTFSMYASKKKCKCSCPCGSIPLISQYVMKYNVNAKSLTTYSYGINH